MNRPRKKENELVISCHYEVAQVVYDALSN